MKRTMEAAVVHPLGDLCGSIVGTRNDLAEAVAFAAAGKVRAHIHDAKLADIKGGLADLRAGRVDGRIVIDLG